MRYFVDIGEVKGIEELQKNKNLLAIGCLVKDSIPARKEKIRLSKKCRYCLLTKRNMAKVLLTMCTSVKNNVHFIVEWIEFMRVSK